MKTVLVVVVLATTLLMGCGKPGTATASSSKTEPSAIKLEDFKAKFAKVQKGMTEAEVIDIIGRPQRISDGSPGRASWGYEPIGQGIGVYAIVFQDGKVDLIANF